MHSENWTRETCQIDISTYSKYATSRKTQVKRLEEKRKGSEEHKQEIADHDLKKRKDPANIVFNISTPSGIQNKCIIFLPPSLVRHHVSPVSMRQRKTLRQMTKLTFALEVSSSGREYARQVIDEADKNHVCDSILDDTIADDEFSDIDLPTLTTEIVQSNSTVQSTASVTTNYRIEHQMNVAQTILGSSQIINIPRETNNCDFNIAPNK
ncbi:LOW QUALITY PROTEIN: hypothetical protein MAR_000474 [Mya arenaria]|uniref:Uncharacterized protein n=1 Tax=Mya arenaria TaxID=6604 RepID=A0ABY7FCX5_MYAAR|nr:LOW QUALITY PROTEIN: hypothetical protein MAR_000474 [Mya arenaria]